MSIKDENKWDKPESFFTVFRCSKREYASQLLKKGTIMFNTPRAWSDMERKSGKGQGDLYEGVFATCGIYNFDELNRYFNKYDDVESENDGNLVYFKRGSVIDMPSYCFFMLKQKFFDIPEKSGMQKLEATIDGRYFQDFANNLNMEEVLKLEKKDQPSIIVIKDMDRFIQMIKDKLYLYGVKDEEILVKGVRYEDKHRPYYSNAKSPEELFLKDNSFEYQAEGRIVINTKDPRILEQLVRKPISVGSIEEFSVQVDSYLEGGMLIEMQADVIELD